MDRFKRFVQQPIVASALVLAAAVTLLLLMGREWWCACGEWSPWSGETASLHNSQHLFDPYAFTHVLHGIGFYGIFRLLFRGKIRFSKLFLLMIALESGWEVIENTSWVIERYRAATISLGYYGDSILNSLGDIVACALGFVLAKKAPVRVSIAAFLALEGLLLWWIRDSLILNIVMLIWPIEAIRNWQVGG